MREYIENISLINSRIFSLSEYKLSENIISSLLNLGILEKWTSLCAI